MRKLYSVKMTKRNLKFLLTALNVVDDKNLKSRLTVRIVSRLSAIGFWGFNKEKLN